MKDKTVAVVPALNEEGSIAEVVSALRAHVDAVVVVDNQSTDGTARKAAASGADVVSAPLRGYGMACLAGIARAEALGATVVLLLDGDGSDDPAEAPVLLGPVLAGEVELALGVRPAEWIAPGAMTPVQRFGNWLAPRLMRAFVGARYSDMPPYKAIRVDAFRKLDVRDLGHGFTIELLLKAHARALSVCEVRVHCRARTAGVSKVSGTLWGSARASAKILSSIARHSQLIR
jgi:glycosyltransferase involved in cell wall biosynthesis